MLLDTLNAAASLQPLSALRSARLHPLTGARKRQWAMTVNERWRVTFKFKDGDAYDVAIEDYHRG
jgi:proteic killer suppression protein